MDIERKGLLEGKDAFSEDEEINQIRYPHRKGGWTKLEKVLCFLTVACVFLVFVVVGIVAIFGYIYATNINPWQTVFESSKARSVTDRPSPSDVPDLCLTPGCIKAAAAILSNIDESADPCTDFYEFACGQWMRKHPVPESKSTVSFFSESRDRVNQQLRELMERKLNGLEPDSVSMIKDVFDACMDLNNTDKVGSEPLKEVLKNLGGWPVVEGSSWDESQFDWIEKLISIRRSGFSHNILLRLSVDVDFKNNSNYILTLGQALLGMPDRSYYLHGLSDSSTAAYFDLMKKSAKLLGADESAFEDELMESLGFETALAYYSLPREDMRNISEQYNKYTLRELQQNVPQVPWLKYFNGLLNEEIYENETLIVEVPKFISSFADLITSTKKRVIANYMLWRVVAQSIPNLSAEWRRILHEYNMIISGVKQEAPQWETCLILIKSNLDVALSSYYVRQYFDEDSREAGKELFEYIHSEFLKSLDKVDWMAEETKIEAKTKANNMLSFIGYTKELLNDTLISEFYKNLTLTKDNHFDNIRKLFIWSYDYEFSQLRKPNIRGEWKKFTRAAIINAFYNPSENSMIIPAGILQNGFFDKNRPHYLNFAAIGFIVAHEITHAFDDIGRQFDENGNSANWWDKKTEENFKEKTECIVDQYSNYITENGMKINGIQTLGENIADNGGFITAYKAYHSWLKDNGPEKRLPGLKYSPSQLFWISAANIWCGKFRPEALKLRIITGDHSPNKFRIIGGLSNLVEFSEEFNCAPHSPMNRKQKCKIW